ncbi:MAG: hypothetical protein EPGJADBJ_03372 [Saprospiraceae bacterium]|nr:hypothetical protein [Saprospiraceae bacterium]
MRNLLQSMLLLAAFPVIAQNFNLQLRSTLEYPGQTLANICGYAQGGREYALLGGSAGLIVVDVTDPDNPVNIVQIQGPEGTPNFQSLWKEIKVYQHYAYLTTEAGGGLQIIDLSNLPNPNLAYHSYTGDGDIAGQLTNIHALHIDAKKGFLYLYGGQLLGGAAKVLDLNADPYNPTYVGKFDALGYIHDGYAENDTLYACHIYSGLLSIVDMADKSNPVLLGTVQTPGKFTHNAWLTGDRKHILTTDEDEDSPSFVTSYDISDPQDIKELDRVSTNDGTGSIGHNVHVINDWAVTSWYTDGVVISDAHRPDNHVITGWYDTWPGNNFDKFQGCWGVYPYLPSGTVVASNIPNTNGGTGKLFVMTPTYVRACYLEGKITNGCNGQPMIGATIEVNSGNPWVNTATKNDGTFKTGQVEPGNFQVTISKPGFASQTLDISLATAEVTELNVTLQPANVTDIEGEVLEEGTQTPIANANITLIGPDGAYTVQADANGHYSLECLPAGDYTINAGLWGYQGGSITVDEQNLPAGVPPIYLEKGYYDDFAVDLGWTQQSTASSGAWERGEPIGTDYQNEYANPEFDIDSDDNDECYVTGNGGGDVSTDDVDGGTVTLTSPILKLAGAEDAVLSFWYWFFNDGGNGSPNDKFEVRATNGNQTVTLFTETASASEWRFSEEFYLKNFLTLNDNVRIQFITGDQQPGHLVEAGVDAFKVEISDVLGLPSGIDATAFLRATPNPSASDFALRYDWPNAQQLTLEVRNALGQLVYAQQLSANNGAAVCGNNWPTGVYIATLRSHDRHSAPLRLIKQ